MIWRNRFWNPTLQNMQIMIRLENYEAEKEIKKAKAELFKLQSK